MDITNCIIVTGANSGMGLATVVKLVSSQQKVLAVDRTTGAVKEIYKDNVDVACLECDLMADVAVEQISAALKQRSWIPSGFVHFAGFVRTAPISMISERDARELYSIHALFPMRFLGWFTKKSNHAPASSCLLISSMACHEGDKGNVAYAAAKGAVEGMLQSAAAELAPKGVRLNALVLGIVDTPLARKAWMDASTEEQMNEKKRTYPLGFGTPADVADIANFFLSNDSHWITGQTLICDGGHSVF